MADLRRLIVSLAPLSMILGCSIGPFLAEPVSGRVLDKQTGAPVPDATVFNSYEYETFGFGWEGGGSSEPICGRWTTTDAAGKFFFYPHPCLHWAPLGLRYEGPYIEVLHPAYGTIPEMFPYFEMEGSEIVFRIQPNPIEIERWHRDSTPGQRRYELCTALDEKACDHACEVVYGSETCTVAPIRLEPQPVPEIRGTVVDKRRESPVVGIEVYASWWAPGYPFETRVARTDEHGQFLIPAHKTVSAPTNSINLCPTYEIVHPDYGWGIGYANPKEVGSPPGCFNPAIEIEPNPKEIEEVQDPKRWENVCRMLAPRACQHACQVVHGYKSVCSGLYY
jgi:hypothetical protein